MLCMNPSLRTNHRLRDKIDHQDHQWCIQRYRRCLIIYHKSWRRQLSPSEYVALFWTSHRDSLPPLNGGSTIVFRVSWGASSCTLVSSCPINPSKGPMIFDILWKAWSLHFKPKHQGKTQTCCPFSFFYHQSRQEQSFGWKTSVTIDSCEIVPVSVVSQAMFRWKWKSICRKAPIVLSASVLDTISLQ